MKLYVYIDMKIGILGGTGFVGQNMAQYITKYGYEVVIGSRRTSPSVNAKCSDSVSNWIIVNRLNAVVNLAAECGGIGLNQRHPGTLWQSTAEISHNVLNGILNARSIGQNAKLIMVGTVCSYAAECPVPFKEEYLMNYGAPEETNRAYGVAKLSALYGAIAFQKEHGLNVCNLIPANMYGRFDNFSLDNSHVVPAMINKFIAAKNDKLNEVILWGDGTPTREFLHASDFAQATLLAIEGLENSEFINIGTGAEISMSELANKIANIVGYTGQVVWDDTKPNGQARRCIDITKAAKLLGYWPSINLEQGLIDTIEWYKHERTTK